MLHRVSKFRFKHGSDANKMLMRKLLMNFLLHGKLSVTIKKAKAIKPYVERLVEKSKNKTESNRNLLITALADKKMVSRLFAEIGPALKDKTGGYVRIKRTGFRGSDAAEMATIEWAYPVVKVPEVIKPVKKETKTV